jgi:hypothetical protein
MMFFLVELLPIVQWGSKGYAWDLALLWEAPPSFALLLEPNLFDYRAAPDAQARPLVSESMASPGSDLEASAKPSHVVLKHSLASPSPPRGGTNLWGAHSVTDTHPRGKPGNGASGPLGTALVLPNHQRLAILMLSVSPMKEIAQF